MGMTPVFLACLTPGPGIGQQSSGGSLGQNMECPQESVSTVLLPRLAAPAVWGESIPLSNFPGPRVEGQPQNRPLGDQFRSFISREGNQTLESRCVWFETSIPSELLHPRGVSALVWCNWQTLRTEKQRTAQRQLCIQDAATFRAAYLQREMWALPPVPTEDSSLNFSFQSALSLWLQATLWTWSLGVHCWF